MEIKETIIFLIGMFGVFLILVSSIVFMENYFENEACLTYGEMVNKKIKFKSSICFVEYGDIFIPKEEFISIRSNNK